MASAYRNTVALIMRDGRARIARDVYFALQSRGINIDISEITHALRELAMSGELERDGRGSFDHPQIYQMKERTK